MTGFFESLARHANIKTLFVPHGARGFIDLDGNLTLRKVLVPVAAAPDPGPTLAYAARATDLAGGEPVDLIALHVGGHDPKLAFPPPSDARSAWRTVHVEGDPEEEIVRFAEREQVDLVFMATKGNDVITHVGIAIDNNTWIQARRPGDVVRVGPLPSKSSIVAVRRFIP